MALRFFTGVGSREVTEDEHYNMRRIAFNLVYHKKMGLRSGKAPGSDEAFQMGAELAAHKGVILPHEIYLPWPGFESKNRRLSMDYDIVPELNYDRAVWIARNIHYNFDGLKQGAQKLHTRNVYQDLGADTFHPSDFVLFTADEGKNGLPTGGTRTAVLLAMNEGIPTFNMRGKTFEETLAWVKMYVQPN